VNENYTRAFQVCPVVFALLANIVLGEFHNIFAQISHADPDVFGTS
jgi:hypothetical protein